MDQLECKHQRNTQRRASTYLELPIIVGGPRQLIILHLWWYA